MSVLLRFFCVVSFLYLHVFTFSEDGYDVWLRYEHIDNETIRSEYLPGSRF